MGRWSLPVTNTRDPKAGTWVGSGGRSGGGSGVKQNYFNVNKITQTLMIAVTLLLSLTVMIYGYIEMFSGDGAWQIRLLSGIYTPKSEPTIFYQLSTEIAIKLPLPLPTVDTSNQDDIAAPFWPAIQAECYKIGSELAGHWDDVVTQTTSRLVWNDLDDGLLSADAPGLLTMVFPVKLPILISCTLVVAISVILLILVARKAAGQKLINWCVNSYYHLSAILVHGILILTSLSVMGGGPIIHYVIQFAWAVLPDVILWEISGIMDSMIGPLSRASEMDEGQELRESKSKGGLFGTTGGILQKDTLNASGNMGQHHKRTVKSVALVTLLFSASRACQLIFVALKMYNFGVSGALIHLEPNFTRYPNPESQALVWIFLVLACLVIPLFQLTGLLQRYMLYVTEAMGGVPIQRDDMVANAAQRLIGLVATEGMNHSKRRMIIAYMTLISTLLFHVTLFLCGIMAIESSKRSPERGIGNHMLCSFPMPS